MDNNVDVKALLKEMRQDEKTLELARKFLETAIGEENINFVKLLLMLVDENLETAFKCAVRKNHTEIVKLIVEAGVNIHTDNEYALRVTAGNGNVDIVKLLLENGAEVHANDDYSLNIAAEKGYAEVVKLLLEAGADARK